MVKKNKLGLLGKKGGTPFLWPPFPPMHPTLSTLGVLHFKKSDRSGEGLIFNRESGLVLEKLESWQFMSAMNCKKWVPGAHASSTHYKTYQKYYKTGDSPKLSPPKSCIFRWEMQVCSHRKTPGQCSDLGRNALSRVWNKFSKGRSVWGSPGHGEETAGSRTILRIN